MKEDSKDIKLLSPENLDDHDKERIVEKARKKIPHCSYCRYNVEHVFTTVMDRERHEEDCPQKSYYQKNEEKT